MSRTRTPFFPEQMSIELCGGENSTPIETHQGNRATLTMLMQTISNGSYEDRVSLIKVKKTTGECIQELKVWKFEDDGLLFYFIK